MTTKDKPVKGKDGSTKMKRQLPCALTDTDRVRLGNELAEALGTEEELAAELAAFKTEHKSRLLPVQAKVARLSNCLRDGTEQREVECLVVRDLKAGSVKIIRTDTEELVDERAMTDAERQVDLNDKLSPGQAPAGEKPKPPAKPTPTLAA